MKKLIVLLFCFGLLTLHAQNSFEFTYGTSDDELLLNAIEDNGGNVVIVGRIGNRSTFNYDPLILKVNPDGSYVSKRLNRPDTNGYFATINLLQDSNYLITGSYGLTSGLNYEYYWVCKLDTNLNVLFEKTYHLVDSSSIYTGIALEYSLDDNDNNIVVAGGKSFEQFFDMCLIKLNQQGDTLLTRTHHFEFGARIINITCIPESNDYLGIAGLINFHNYGPVRFDSVFNILDVKHFYANFDNKGTSDHWLNDTTYMYSCANTDLNSSNLEERICVFNIDTALRYHKSVVLDKPDTSDYPAWRTSMAYANDSTVYIGGFINYLEFYPTEPNCIELYLIDTGLNLLGYKEFGWNANYDVWGMVATSDNGCLLYGNVRTEENTTESDVHIIKVRREDFDITTTVKTIENVAGHAKLWPNPARNKLHIELPETVGKSFEFQILNLEGKTYTRRKVAGNGNVLDINIQPLPAGTYVYHITGNGHKISGKFIKMN
ncbi:MAG: hypothetical protein DRJ09_01985 [Bacteroidetes bacterium]|nr:MAG: hypothetical protein DRJ09_01985 [Bacteroidota bacterium]